LIFDFGDISKNAPNYIYAGGADDKKKNGETLSHSNNP
jgi:hypothetical protein